MELKPLTSYKDCLRPVPPKYYPACKLGSVKSYELRALKLGSAICPILH